MKLKLAISPCPNDTFMFDALINKKIDTKNFDFEIIIDDIEKLNTYTKQQEVDISKTSFHNFLKISDSYQLLNSGTAMGKNCGPLIVSKRKIYPNELKDCKIAIPGESTTANLLMQIFFNEAQNKNVYLFSDIEELVLSNECDAGLLIHETRFTYQKRGLKLIADLGNLWENKFNLPIPLGGIIVKRSLPDKIKQEIDKMLCESINLAFKNLRGTISFMKKHAVEMDEEIMMQHVNLYVNEYSKDIGDLGKKSIYKLREEFLKLNNLEEKSLDLFL
ncbi:MAG TPA: 1,4-dihydroxy-6-naphthoate synthase [Bacteroidales bacterium]|nr:1,4-dihydroxy-6-naphthoate synthase [Bacteroidales bacterium]HOR60057.1 1,4-dihydroxy-6-naphthoate synthase [Bacteroidales bacterium]HPL03621.1 1,4-dihydroxy-6-naphthoate synthase [Bacteroidales bacterium]